MSECECWYCSLPDYMFDEFGRMLPEYQDYATPWLKPQDWLSKEERIERLARRRQSNGDIRELFAGEITGATEDAAKS